jgi:hypothetical protein
MKLCIDCKWHKQRVENGPHWCMLFAKTSPIDGELKLIPCESNRYPGDKCGEEGVYWEPKDGD